jgi:hypothetical protein
MATLSLDQVIAAVERRHFSLDNPASAVPVAPNKRAANPTRATSNARPVAKHRSSARKSCF